MGRQHEMETQLINGVILSEGGAPAFFPAGETRVEGPRFSLSTFQRIHIHLRTFET